MTKDIIDIVIEKEFVQLSAEEKIELGELCTSEEEFNHMKSVLVSVEGVNYKSETPRKETKESLDFLFDQTYPKAPRIWYNSVLTTIVPLNKPFYKQPLLHAAALVVLLLLVVPLYQSNINQNKVQVAQTETVVESSKADKQNNSVTAEQIPTEDMLSDQIQTGNSSDQGGMASISHNDDPLFSSTIPAPISAFSSDHPDGIYDGYVGGREVATCQPASETTDLMDLLTSTF